MRQRSDADYIAEFRHVLDEAVRLRLRADVPVGCYLSGGLDSCAVLGLAARHRADPIRAFTLTFDRSKFVTAYSANPAGVQDAVAGGLAKQLDTVTKAATDPLTGSLTTAIQGGNSQVKNLNDQISDWNVRLAARQTAYQRQFTQLEVALGKMKDQSSWLSGQIAGLSPSGA